MIAPRYGKAAGGSVFHPELTGGCRDRLDHRHVDGGHLAGSTPSHHRGNHRPRRSDARTRIADGDTGLARLATLVSVGRVQTGDRPADGPVGHGVRIGAVLAVSRQRHDDDLGVDAAKVVGAEAQPRHRADPEVVDDDIADGHQPLYDFPCCGISEIDPDASLVGVVQVEHARRIRSERHASRRIGQPPEHAEVRRRLEFDHIGTEMCELLRAEWAGPDPAEVAYADTRKRKRCRLRGLPQAGRGDAGCHRPSLPALAVVFTRRGRVPS